ncbi:hypothetical protein ATK74_2930 [Propionicimonas paludicola]|uniref:Uncharacterized protein n=1 Tax=Propionicimonas paludicola TaxID=185243 RepID=A0A2A9CW37_9ACTN|nr:hypothetical protein [Propionicimonas paludicola]PFG18346.1 hypothetical protein ATK74_2930 [Propionicimonas paludicola]
MTDDPSFAAFIAAVWGLFQIVFPFVALGLLISIHLRLKDVAKQQSETYRQMLKLSKQQR